eukprot:TRINITY_DN1821_c0_g1_i1.p1 TRINITY_DN1821_c0_g1~~TRINITY_DN1821_c0_g1_i1.p1  ORF type:complete len:225 (+),score=59.33 TRINITY_DN1821_c0_g1_i1:83-757(+)
MSKVPEFEEKKIKVVFVGGPGIGKTSLILRYIKETFEEYIPTVCENFEKKVEYNDLVYNFEFWDTAGNEDYDRLRPLVYPCTDIFVFLVSLVGDFSYNYSASVEAVKALWMPEVSQAKTDAIFILVGTKSDLKLDPEMQEKADNPEKYPGFQFIGKEEGENLANEIGAVSFTECSSLTGEGVQDVLNAIVEAYVNNENSNDQNDNNDNNNDDSNNDNKKLCLIS